MKPADKKPPLVEVCDKATETTPSLFEFDIDDFLFTDDGDDFCDEEGADESSSEDYEGEELHLDRRQCSDHIFFLFASEDEFSCVVCERAFFTSKQLERHQYRKRHWG